MRKTDKMIWIGVLAIFIIGIAFLYSLLIPEKNFCETNSDCVCYGSENGKCLFGNNDYYTKQFNGSLPECAENCQPECVNNRCQ